jgi:hypothetical protein
MSFWANVLLGKRLLGKCLSGQMSFWANVFSSKCLSGQMLSGQMSSGQMSFWANVVWASVTMGKRRMGKCLWADVSGQMSYGQMPWNHKIVSFDPFVDLYGRKTLKNCSIDPLGLFYLRFTRCSRFLSFLGHFR